MCQGSFSGTCFEATERPDTTQLSIDMPDEQINQQRLLNVLVLLRQLGYGLGGCLFSLAIWPGIHVFFLVLVCNMYNLRQCKSEPVRWLVQNFFAATGTQSGSGLVGSITTRPMPGSRYPLSGSSPTRDPTHGSKFRPMPEPIGLPNPLRYPSGACKC